MSGSDPPDLRLAGFTLGVWLSALAALYLSAWAGVGVAVAGLTVAALLVTRAAAGSRTPDPRASGSRGPRSPGPGPGSPGRQLPGRGSPGRQLPGRGSPGLRSPGLRSPGLRWTGLRSPGLMERVAGLLPWGLVRWVCVAAALGVGCGAVATAARVSVREAGVLVALVESGEPVRVEVVVRDDPRPLPRPAGPPTYLVAVDLHSVQAGEAAPVRLSARALVLGADPGWRGLLPGQRVTATGRLLPPRPGDLRVAAVSVRRPPILTGRPSWAQRGAGVLRAGLQRACEPLPGDSGGLLPGLVVGDTSRLDPALEEDFRTTGMTHLTAVSGTNVR